MPAPVEITVFGEPVLRRTLLRYGRNVTDARPAFRAIARILETATRRNFSTAGQASGPRWASLAPSTKARKRALGLDPRILRATGALFESLVATQDGQAGHVEQVGRASLRWGSNVAYGVFHQSRKPRKLNPATGRPILPHRPPVRLNERTKRDAVKELQRHIAGGGR